LTTKTETFRIITMRDTKTARSQAAAVLGRSSYRARVRKFGMDRIREIARQNGKKGGRPRKSEKEA